MIRVRLDKYEQFARAFLARLFLEKKIKSIGDYHAILDGDNLVIEFVKKENRVSIFSSDRLGEVGAYYVPTIKKIVVCGYKQFISTDIVSFDFNRESVFFAFKSGTVACKFIFFMGVGNE